MKSIFASMICLAGFLSSAMGQTLYLDLGNHAVASNGTNGAIEFKKVALNTGWTVNNGTYYQYDNLLGSGLTLTLTNVNTYGSDGNLEADGFYNISGNGPADFAISNVPPGNTVSLYATYAWNGSGAAAKFIYAGVTNSAGPGNMTNPSTSTLKFIGRTVPDGNGAVTGRWSGQGANFSGEGQVGALIIDVQPCQPSLTMVGNNPMLVPVNSGFADPGATAVESCSGSPLVVTTNGAVDANTIGTYYVTYSAVADGITNSIVRTVNVVLSDYVNLDLGTGSSVPAPLGFTKLLRTGNNMFFSVTSVGNKTYGLHFTNVGNAYSAGGSTLDRDGFIATSGNTAGFALSNLVVGSQVTLYACWGWDGLSRSPTITYAGNSTKLNVGTGITSPSITTLMNVGTAVADGNGVVSGTWTYISSAEGQLGGMIFGIQAPVGHEITILPSGITNNCNGSATFVAAAPGGATYQWYNPSGTPITSATNTTLVLTNLQPADSGYYTIIATATDLSWTATNKAALLTLDTAAPVMTMSGSSTMIIWQNSVWADPGVTAYDSCYASSLPVTTNGTVNTSVVGQYDLTYSAMTAGGVPGSLSRTVYVIDGSIQPDDQLALDYQSVSDFYPAPSGFVRIAPFDIGDLNPLYQHGDVSIPDPMGTSSSYVLSLTNISCWNAGTITNFNVSTAGIFNGPSTTTHTAATFSLSGLPSGVVVNLYAVYGWSGASQAARIIYGGKTNQLTVGITQSSPNPPTQNDFQFVGSALANNGVVSGTFYGPTGPTSEGQIGGMIINIQSIPAHNVAITPASSSPICGTNVTLTSTVSGIAPFTYQWYDNHTNLIVGATNASLTLVSVHPINEGNYTLVANNAYGSATNIANISGITDTAPPVMALNGVDPVTIVVNSGPYVDAGAAAYDLCAQSGLAVTSNNPVNVASIGQYTVTYNATTGSGTPGSITRTVNVVPMPNDTLNLDFQTPASVISVAGFNAVKASQLNTPLTQTWANVGGSAYTLSITNYGCWQNNTTNLLPTSGFYSASGAPAYFTLSQVPNTAKVTLYAIYGWDGATKYGNVFFGATNKQIVFKQNPGDSADLTNFTRIGAAIVGPSGAVTGHWQGPGGATAEGQVGAMVFMIGTNIPPVGSNLVMNATNSLPSSLQVVGNAAGPTDPDGDPLTVTAVQSPTPNGGTVTTDGYNVTYASAGPFTGADTFTYTVGDGFGGFATATVSVTVVSGNLPPVATHFTMGAVVGTPASLKIIGNGPTDPNGDTLVISAVQTPTPNAASVSFADQTNIIYTATAPGSDTFNYTISDGHGGFATNTVTASVVANNASFNKLAAPAPNAGHYDVGFQGIPYAYYILLNSPSLNPAVWTPVVTNQADINGVITFQFTPSQATGFYKTSSLQ